MIGLIHNYNHVAGQTVFWDTSDNQLIFEQHMREAESKRRLQELGYTDKNITYSFNSHGFRNQEFTHDIDIVCFGCSFTMGTGVRQEHTWPAQLQQISGLQVANLGHAGSSNDTAFRFANHYLKLIRPKWAVWVQTDRHRIELLDESMQLSINLLASDKSNLIAQEQFVKTWFSSDINQQLNLQKNTFAFEHLCKSLGIKYTIVPRHTVASDNSARDLRHPGPAIYSELAKRILNSLG